MLLIIFMVTATYIVRAAIEVELPRAAHGGEATGTILTVVLTRDGEVYLDGVRRTRRGARRADARGGRARTREHPRGHLAPTRARSTARSSGVIDLVKDAGVTRFAIHVERER